MFDEAVNSIALKALVYGQSIAGGFRAAHERLGSVSHTASVAVAGAFARASLCFSDGLKIKTSGLCRDKQNKTKRLASTVHPSQKSNPPTLIELNGKACTCQ